MFGILDPIVGGGGTQKVKGRVVLMKKNVLDFNDFHASFLDGLHELLGGAVSLQLVSADVAESDNGLRGKLGKHASLENWILDVTLTAGESEFKVTFDYEEGFGRPGAFIIRNNHYSEFFLKSLTLEDVPGHGRIHFLCNSWVYPAKHYTKDRIFFSNKTYLPSETPKPLTIYRQEELVSLRGTGEGELKEWDRVYDYAYYNDLADPKKDPRPILGGSAYPYPRRGRTGRKPTESDPKTESRLPITTNLNVYVPRDERFGHLKMSDFLAYALKALVQVIAPSLEAIFDGTPNEYDSFEDVLRMYEEGIRVPDSAILDNIVNNIPLEMLKEFFRTDGQRFLKYPLPQVIQEDKLAWRTDEEFAREMLAGVNPVNIQALQEFPPKSKLNPEQYGDHTSAIRKSHIENNLESLTVDEALKQNRLFILDHHDWIMPYLRRINTTSSKTYASRTLLFLKDDGTLKLLAIELSLPHPNGDQLGAVGEVYTPAAEGIDYTVWQLAKAYVAVNDYGNHELISHWLNTHATMEPFVIATNRQLSVLHPIYKLLQPHYRDTMNINAFARQGLVNAGGIIETIVFPGKYAMEMSSFVYKNYWVFPDQALPVELKKRGIAVEDPEAPHGLRLLIKDYPYAVDGLEVWSLIETWVKDYVGFYYKDDKTVQSDTELQAWWKEIVEVGHEDKKHEPWWPKMQTREELVQSCTIIIWVASALHAAVNFGQYPYVGYMPNRPSLSRKFMPEKGSEDYKLLERDPEKGFLKIITTPFKTLLGVSLLEILSTHASDEVYLGQRDAPEWTTDSEPLQAFVDFGKNLRELEENIVKMNMDPALKNRTGPVQVPYTLLFPTSEGGITGRGIPNSISI